jgi:hypothetical protein
LQLRLSPRVATGLLRRTMSCSPKLGQADKV